MISAKNGFLGYGIGMALANSISVAGLLADIIGIILGGGVETAELAQLANNIIYYKEASNTSLDRFGRL